MMDQWLQKAKPGDKGLTRPTVSAHVSVHKYEVRSIARGFFQIQFRVPTYKHVGRPTHDSQKRECVLNDVSPYTTVKCPKYPRKERTSLEKNARGGEALEIQITGDRGCGLR